MILEGAIRRKPEIPAEGGVPQKREEEEKAEEVRQWKRQPRLPWLLPWHNATILPDTNALPPILHGFQHFEWLHTVSSLSAKLCSIPAVLLATPENWALCQARGETSRGAAFPDATQRLPRRVQSFVVWQYAQQPQAAAHQRSN
jgi:hypothetical protein